MAPGTQPMETRNHGNCANMASSPAPFVDEDPILQEAIQESLRAGAFRTNPGVEAQSNATEADQSPKQRVSIDDRIKDMALRAAIELPVVHDPRADTWIFIDPPQKQPEQDQLDYERYIKRYESPIAMRKETLVKYSPVLERMFLPTAQHRITRRRNLVKELRNSPNIKYVIDLTPPTEGEEAVYLTTELCCSEGVRLWYQARDIWRVSKILVGGEEEYTSVKSNTGANSPPTTPLTTAKTGEAGDDSSSPGLIAEKGNSTSPESSQCPSSPSITRITLEYTPVRHRSAIERVLSALQGLDPKLDSAPKVWTTSAVAKYFDVKHSELDSYIIRWLRAYPNSYFLEVLPEVSLQIADGLENYDLARDAFAILVGEEALDNLCRARTATSSNSRSAYGRKKENLPEAIFTRVEYASKAFLERITNEFDNFAGNGMQWIDTLPEFQKLSSYTKPEVQDTISALKVLLKDYVRGAIYKLLCVNYDSVPAADLQHPGGEDLLPRVNRSSVWKKLSPNERILSRTFWQALISFKLFDGRTNLDIKEGWNMIWDSINLSENEHRELHRGTYREILRSSLGRLVRDLSYCISSDEPQSSYTLPIRTVSGARGALADLNDASSAPLGLDDPFHGAQNLPSEPNAQATFTSAFDQISEPKQPDQRVATNWSFGSPRQDPAQGILGNTYAAREISPPNAFSAVDKGQTNQIISQWPAPDGLPSWSASGDEDEDRGADEVSRLHQSELERLETPPFIKDNVVLPGQPYRRIAPFPKDTTASPQSRRKKPWLFFDLEEFFLQAHRYIGSLGWQKLQCSDQYLREEPLEIGLTNTLVCLQDSEWKYLPLWAGGNDDGSGGVYIDQPDTADLGFSSPGPDIHTGTPATSIKSPSELDFEHFDIVSDYSSATSTFNNSMINNRGFSDNMRRNRVYVADSTDASSHQSAVFTDDFTMVTDEDEEELARRQMEIQEELDKLEEETAREARRIEKGKDQMIDENYADLFDQEEEDDEGDDTDRAEMEFEDEDEDEDMVLV